MLKNKTSIKKKPFDLIKITMKFGVNTQRLIDITDNISVIPQMSSRTAATTCKIRDRNFIPYCALYVVGVTRVLLIILIEYLIKI